jgi:hypothetical protein
VKTPTSFAVPPGAPLLDRRWGGQWRVRSGGGQDLGFFWQKKGIYLPSWSSPPLLAQKILQRLDLLLTTLWGWLWHLSVFPKLQHMVTISQPGANTLIFGNKRAFWDVITNCKVLCSTLQELRKSPLPGRIVPMKIPVLCWEMLEDIFEGSHPRLNMTLQIDHCTSLTSTEDKVQWA